MFFIEVACTIDAYPRLGEGRCAAGETVEGNCAGLRRIEWGTNELVLGPRIVAGAEWCLFFGSLYKWISL